MLNSINDLFLQETFYSFYSIFLYYTDSYSDNLAKKTWKALNGFSFANILLYQLNSIFPPLSIQLITKKNNIH
uniref:CSON014703 protein n=1 Tax=Culicoides sonorensis TaxID=179676 RepID=A0A336MBB1_CULSO